MYSRGIIVHPKSVRWCSRKLAVTLKNFFTFSLISARVWEFLGDFSNHWSELMERMCHGCLRILILDPSAGSRLSPLNKRITASKDKKTGLKLQIFSILIQEADLAEVISRNQGDKFLWSWIFNCWGCLASDEGFNFQFQQHRTARI